MKRSVNFGGRYGKHLTQANVAALFVHYGVGDEHTAQKVYEAYRDEPEKYESSNLFNHYKRGLAGLDGPSKKQALAHAAWRAGREKFEQSQNR